MVSKKSYLWLPCVLTAVTSNFAAATEVFDIRVSYYDTYNNAIARKAGIEANIRHFADGVYEVSNGAHRIGKVEIYTDGAYKDNADIVWIATCWPNANISGRGAAGSRIEHCDTFPNGGTPMLFVDKQRSGGYTITHEWGHFTYALYDEYQSSGTACDAKDPGGACKDDVAIENSAMHSQWKAVGENESIGDLTWLNFSTSLNNNAATVQSNAQARIYKASAWETLLRDPALDPIPQGRKLYADLAAVAPAAGQAPSIEINIPENIAKAEEKLTFEWKRGNQGEAGTRAASPVADKVPMVKMIVIDNSVNVHPRQLAAVKTTVEQLILQSELYDVIGLASFSNTTNVLSVPTLLKTEADKQTLIQLVKSIKTTTQVPALGLALQKANEVLGAANTINEYDKDIYLFAHGFNAEGVSPKEVVPSLHQASIRVFSFALNEPTEGALRDISEKTGGKAWLTPSLAMMESSLSNLEQFASPMLDVIVSSNQAQIATSKEFPFYVDSALGELDINIDYDGDLNAATFKLVDPKGGVSAVTAENCFANNDPDSDVKKNVCFFSVIEPLAGDWKLQVSGNATVNYAVKAYPNDNNNVYFASINAAPTLGLQNKPVLITASVSSEWPIAKLNVLGSVKKPDGNMETLNLVDDGSAGDHRANDGIYSAKLTTAQIGEYVVTVKLDNNAGTGQSSNIGTNFAPSSNGQVPSTGLLAPVTDKFERVVQAQILVKPNLQNHQRVMNWAEAVYPNLFANLETQDIDYPPYKVRYYPLSNSYLGFNATDGKMYVYSPSLFGADKGIFPVGEMNSFFTGAQTAGF